MIVERMLYGLHPTSCDTATTEVFRQFSTVEENAIYYTAGYVVRKLLNKYKKLDSDKAANFVQGLLDMLGEDSDNIEACNSFGEYVKMWTIQTDRGGLLHASIDTFRLFKAIEMITYDLMKKGASKGFVVSQTYCDQNVQLHWALITDLVDEQQSSELLQEVVGLWFTVRGFSIAKKLFEQYKTAKKCDVKGTKGLRKELH